MTPSGRHYIKHLGLRPKFSLTAKSNKYTLLLMSTNSEGYFDIWTFKESQLTYSWDQVSVVFFFNFFFFFQAKNEFEFLENRETPLLGRAILHRIHIIRIIQNLQHQFNSYECGNFCLLFWGQGKPERPALKEGEAQELITPFMEIKTVSNDKI